MKSLFIRLVMAILMALRISKNLILKIIINNYYNGKIILLNAI